MCVNACHSRSRSAHARFRARHRSVYGHRRWYHHGAGTKYGDGIVRLLREPRACVGHRQHDVARWVADHRAPPIFSSLAAILIFMPIVQIGFGVLVLIGLWLTFVGWIAKTDLRPAPPTCPVGKVLGTSRGDEHCAPLA
jgi:hypothetical protein